MLDIRLQVEVKARNMVKHPLGIYHWISTPYAILSLLPLGCVSPMVNTYGMLDHVLILNLHL